MSEHTIKQLYEISITDIKDKVKDCLKDENLRVNELYIRNFSIWGEISMKTFCIFSLHVEQNSDQYRKAMYLLNYAKQTLNDKNKGKTVYNISIEDFKTMISESSEKDVPIPLSDILSCSDFINVFNDPGSDTKVELKELLSKHQNMNYDDIKKAVDSSSLNPENKKIVFTEVLPAYDFKLCNDFNSTLNMFKDGYIDFDTLVTKFWTRDDFDKDQNNTDQQNAFQNFARKYKIYADYQNNDISSLKSSTKNMIDALRDKYNIGDQAASDLKDQIDNAADVGIFGIIAQFFSNLFSKGKTAFKLIQKIKQDRVISNLKPLSGILRQAAGRHKEDNDKLI